MPEYVNMTTGNTWSDGSEYSPEEAKTMMVSHMEGTLNNKDEELGILVDSVIKEA